MISEEAGACTVHTSFPSSLRGGRSLAPPVKDSMLDLKEKAAAWLAKDPDPASREKLQDLLANDARADLEQAFCQRLSFGTAGLRGLMGVGPNNMNVRKLLIHRVYLISFQSLVIRETTSGLADFIQEARLEPGPRQRVVIAYDGRHGSKQCKQKMSKKSHLLTTRLQFPKMLPVSWQQRMLMFCSMRLWRPPRCVDLLSRNWERPLEL